MLQTTVQNLIAANDITNIILCCELTVSSEIKSHIKNRYHLEKEAGCDEAYAIRSAKHRVLSAHGATTKQWQEVKKSHPKMS